MSKYEARKSPVDEMWRIWKLIDWVELGWMDSPTEINENTYIPKTWVTVAVRSTHKKAMAYIESKNN
tara:strand:- start:1864 stop:2064 length:201 start_codon:yes stop_codon:yes gene_type:complete